MISAQRWRQIDQTSATKQKEKRERERSGEEKGGGGGREVERNDISFLPSVFPAAGEEKLADEARDERRAHPDRRPKGCEIISGILR